MRKSFVTLVGTVILLLVCSLSVFAESRFVQASVLNLRTEPNTDSTVIDQPVRGDEVELLEITNENWVKVSFGGRSGYVARQYLAVSREATQLGSRSGRREYSEPTVVDYAKQFIGTPYVYGGSTPSGFDCSGFVKYVYSQFGVNLSRTSYSQVLEGTYVPRSELQPGDLVFFGSESNVHHVGIYVADGTFIHSPRSGKTVCIETLDSGYYNDRYYTARRVK